jgi:hypothetical protein
MRAYQHIVKEINKALKSGDIDHPRIHGFFMKLVIVDPIIWQPLYLAYLTKGRSMAPLDQVPDNDPFDRGGKK